MPCRAGRDFPIPVEDEILHREAFAALGLPLISLGSRAEERHDFLPAGDKLVGRDIAGMDEVSAGQQTLCLAGLVNFCESVAINEGRGRGLHMRDQVLAALVARLGQMHLVTDHARYPKAVECVRKDQRALLAFFDWPAEHWIHLRTTDEIDKHLSADCGNLSLRGRPRGEERGIDWKLRRAA
ncbi:hypothetical protein GR304_23630 [Microvirga sp. SYSU G3D207]|uniref:Uncharacterized protein n=1 Tax=Microvirga arsenatis TaxID=2692265 RepID=A0ABW9Z431_9HYPH|nr:hypothetical protein [Microvirga arsenatis]NBJ13851.1 hypothetical protein [Microvirga arsenatis]NBJ27307.1 hypothetical protein [Microvirga arsenatis]